MAAMTATRSVILLLLAGSLRLGQTRPEFEVASIVVSKNSPAPPAVRITPGRISMENLTLRPMIFAAYKVNDFQISGGPGWVNSDRYDIDAKTDGRNGADAMMMMLQALLEDRFHLGVHHEMKDGAVYVLTQAKNGSKMQQATRVPLAPDNLPKEVALTDKERRERCTGISRGDGTLNGNGVSIEDVSGPALRSLVGQLSFVLERPVINRTGLSGRFDVQLRWSTEAGLVSGGQTGHPFLQLCRSNLG